MATKSMLHPQDSHESLSAADTVELRSKFTIVFFGDSSVGKTSLILRFLGYGFSDEYQPTIEDFFIKHVFYKNKTFELQLIDTTGTYEFPAMRKVDILKADAFVLVYTPNNPASFKRLNRYRSEILEERKDKYPSIVVCNKSDLGINNIHQPTFKDHRGMLISLQHLVETQWKYHWIECSAKENQRVEQIFYKLLDDICKLYHAEAPQRKISSLLQLRKRSTSKQSVSSLEP
jgi:small GTP-binding protein